MPTQYEFDDKYIKMCQIWATLSKAKRKQVGCLIVKGDTIISDGYNGTPKGFNNECEYKVDEHLVTKQEVLHAETNAISKLARSTNTSLYSTLYTTYSPCFECSKLIIQSGIDRVVYLESYRDQTGIELLKKANINITHFIIK